MQCLQFTINPAGTAIGTREDDFMTQHVTTKHIVEEDLLTRQKEKERAMLEELSSGDYTFSNPLIKLNPYLINPCAAVALFRTKKETAVTITVRGKTPEGNISHTYPPAATHILPILGLYSDYTNTVDIQLYQGAIKTVTITTAPTDGTAELIHMRTSAEHMEGSLIVVTPAGFGRLTGFDYSGTIRWYINIGLQMGVKRLKNGHLLVGTDRLIGPPYYSTGLYELDMVGKIYAEYQIPGGYHHDQLEMPDGSLLVLTDNFDEENHTVEDVCALLDRETGAIKRIWNFKAFLTPGEGSSGLATKEDWFHCNALWYDDKTNSITFSGRHVDALVNIDFDSGAINWIIGDPDGWPEDKKRFFFKPSGDGEFSWQYAQHSCLVTPDGDVMCFDNGTLRSKRKENYLKNKDNYSRAVRFRINTDSRTIAQVWSYGQDLGSEFFSQHISNVDYLGEDHYLIHSGGIQFYDGVPVEEMRPPFPDDKAQHESLTFELKQDRIVLEMKIKSNFYRALKLPIYYDEGFNLTLTEGKKLGNLAVTKKAYAGIVPAASGESLPESCLAHIIEERDRISLKARFEKGQNAMLLLVQGDAINGYPVNMEAKFAFMSCLPYIESDEKNTSTTVNKNGLSGLYEVKVIIDDILYETGVVITC